ncbi:MAG: OFA family MFS transporter [Phycisphaerae bacterium]|nr:OFA family MFS transporter [Phycisphaerae bacterium]
MADDITVSKNHGWSVTFAGMGINLALGILYTWSVISKGVPAEWGWTETDKSLPYMFACLIFSIVMVPAGRMQDKIGPKIVASIGGVLVGLGFLLASLTTTPLIFVLGFGVLAGAGIGFGYASATPPAVKWFPAAKTGTIAGIVVSGFGLASVYAAPLTKWLIGQFGLQHAMLILGIGFFIIITGLKSIVMPLWNGLSATLQAPPAGFVPETISLRQKAVHDPQNLTPKEMLCTIQFYLIWFMYACGAGAGLMIIAKLAAIAKIQAGVELGFILVAVLAIGNGAGRIIAGILSDKIGRKATLFICFISQAILIMLISQAKDGNVLTSVPLMAVISAFIGANYGANLALFPSITKDYYGLKNFGVNYGLVFTAWGVGGFMLAFLAGKMYDIHQTFAIAYYGAAILLVLAAICVFLVRKPKHLD